MGGCHNAGIWGPIYLEVVSLVADGPSEDGGEEAVAHPRQVEAGVRLDEQVGHDEVVCQAGERVLAHAWDG